MVGEYRCLTSENKGDRFGRSFDCFRCVAKYTCFYTCTRISGKGPRDIEFTRNRSEKVDSCKGLGGLSSFACESPIEKIKLTRLRGESDVKSIPEDHKVANIR